MNPDRVPKTRSLWPLRVKTPKS